MTFQSYYADHLTEVFEVRWAGSQRQVGLKVKRLGEGGTQTFDMHILPEI